MDKKQELSKKELKQLNKNELCKMVLEMQDTVQDVHDTVRKKDETISAQEKQINILTQEVQLLRAQRFGRKSERTLEKAVEDGQMVMDCILNEAEMVSDKEAEAPKEVVIKEHVRKTRTKGKQEEDLSKLRKDVDHVRIDEDKLQELFPNGYRELTEDISSQIEFSPAEYYVKERHVHIYCAKDDNSKIIRADAPKKLFGKGLASPSLVAAVMNAKYVNGTPLYRIEQEFERNDVPIRRNTMANWIILGAERYFSLLIERMKQALFSHHVIHADETTMLVTKDERKAGSKSYMWIYRSGELDPHPVVIFDYQKTRHFSHPQQFLEDFQGILVTDGYEVYHKLVRLRNGTIIVAGCWVHALRKFKDALKGMGKSGSQTAAGSIAGEAVRRIGKLFDLDNKLNQMTPEQRLEVRQKKLKPLVDEFFEWIIEHRKDVTPKSLTGKAITYCINQQEYLRVFLKHGDVPMDNNAAERAIRPFCIGRKNWIMSDTIHGAEASGLIYSIVETAKANDLKPYEYLKYLLEEIPKHVDESSLDFLDELLPWAESLPAECRKRVSE